MSDPRYSQIARSSGGGSSPVINVSDNRNPMFDLALLGMLAMQFILLALIAWRMMATPVAAESTGAASAEQVAQIQNLNQDKLELRGLLMELVDPSSENEEKLNKMLAQFEETQIENRRLETGFDAQLVQTETLKKNSELIKENLADAKREQQKLSKSYGQTRAALKEKMDRVEELETAIEEGRDPDDEEDGLTFDFSNNWWWALLGCLVTSIGSVAGTLFYIRQQSGQDSSQPEDANDSEQPSA